MYSQERENEVQKLAAMYLQGVEPIEAVSNILHDFDQMMCDHLRGRSKFDGQERTNWYHAYRVICGAAQVIPIASSKFMGDDYPVEGHHGSIFDLLEQPPLDENGSPF